MSLSPQAEQLLKARNNRDVSFFDVLSIEQFSAEDLRLVWDVARAFRAQRTFKFDFGKGSSMINAFFEPSTRTMSSFDLAGKHLSMDTNNVGTGSSLKKGESYHDTLATLDAYNVKAVVVRATQSGLPFQLASTVRTAIINAGDGMHEHPTQALLDGLTMLDHFSAENLEGKVVTIVGDIRHSRVFGSLVRLLNSLKATVRVAAPHTLLPAQVERFGVEIFTELAPALEQAQVVYALRVQEERGAKGFVPSLREYSRQFGITRARLDLADPQALLMHPGPVRRDIDVHSALVNIDSQSAILQQVENGLAIRKTLLWLLAERYDQKTKSFTRC